MIGAGARTRTADLLITNRPLDRLSPRESTRADSTFRHDPPRLHQSRPDTRRQLVGRIGFANLTNLHFADATCRRKPQTTAADRSCRACHRFGGGWLPGLGGGVCGVCDGCVGGGCGGFGCGFSVGMETSGRRITNRVPCEGAKIGSANFAPPRPRPLRRPAEASTLDQPLTLDRAPRTLAWRQGGRRPGRSARRPRCR
jgi:hypothetical protein